MKRMAKTRWLALLAVVSLGACGTGVAQTIHPLPFANAPSATSFDSLWQQITNGGFYRAYPCNTSNDFRRFRGVFTPASASTQLAIHSDDGSWIKINSQTELNFYGENTHFQSSSALRLVPYTFTANQPYCVEIYYTNHQHTAGDLDGVTLYAYNGVGTAVDGIPLLGPDFICKGSTGFFQTTCDFGSYTWSSASPSVANGSSSTPFIDISGLAAGTTTLTVTDDATGKSGSKTIKVVQLGFTPTSGVVCVGIPISFVITNAEVTNGVTWSAVQTTAGHPRTNTLTFTNGATNTIIASWSGCSQSVTGKVTSVAVTSLTATTNNLCGGGSVTYAATTTPPGFEYLVGWGGEFLGSGGTQTVTYTTPGIKSVNATCNGTGLSVDVTVHKVDITNTLEYALAGGTAAPFGLSADSVGPFTWSVTPSGPTVNGSGSSVTVSGGATPGRAHPDTAPGARPSGRFSVQAAGTKRWPRRLENDEAA